MINLIGWTGAVAMVAFSFSVFVPLALFGMACLTVQAIATKTWNLVALNIISTCGFAINLL